MLVRFASDRGFLTVAILICAIVLPAAAAPEAFRDWPAKANPVAVGKRLAENWASRSFEYEQTALRKVVIYPEVCAWYGALRVAELTNDSDLGSRLVKKFDPFLSPEGQHHIDRRPHVDHFVFGIVPLEVYLLTHDKKYLDFGKVFADAEWENPTEDGITRQARYWIDDMYMITAVQVQAFRATQDRKYLDRAALTMSKYLDKLQQPNGLFYHAPDSPYFWGRGNGWIAAGAAELLHSLPEGHPQRAHILQGVHKMLATLKQYQTKEGLWRQLVDKPASWPETSGSAMFAFAMIRGVKDGWLLEAEYAPAARNAWLALVDRLDENANIRDVCVGTNKGFSEQYYLDRSRTTGDLHGQAAVIWCAMALLE